MQATDVWYLLDYKWTGTKWVYRPQEEMPGTLTSMDATRSVVNVGEERLAVQPRPWESW